MFEYTDQMLRMFDDIDNPLIRLLRVNKDCTLKMALESKKTCKAVYFDVLTATWSEETTVPLSGGRFSVGVENLGRCGLQ